jgi:hypothetical protein
MADLGISQSYFSCQKCSESDHVRITKVVVFITMNPTKLILHFSEFYDFLRNLQESANLQILLKLYFCAEAHEKIRPFAMWPLAMAGGAGKPNSGDSGEGIGRERVWGGGGAHPRPICHLARG